MKGGSILYFPKLYLILIITILIITEHIIIIVNNKLLLFALKITKIRFF